MARTKQTARKSTGGKALKVPLDQQLATSNENENITEEAFKLAPPSKGGANKSNASASYQSKIQEFERNFDDAYLSEASEISPSEDEDDDDDFFGKDRASERDNLPKGLGNLINPSQLLAGKKQLKNVSRKFHPVDLTRQDILASTTDYGAINLQATTNYMKTQSITADVVTLTFNGTDQLTDAFWMLLAMKKITLPKVTRVSVKGCYHLTNASVRYMTKIFNKLENLDLNGCQHVSEESLKFIICKWAGSLEQIDLSGTNVGMIPLSYQGSIKVNGCPMISPTESIYKDVSVKVSKKMERSAHSVNQFKMVFLTDDTVPWSPLDVFRGSKDIKANKTLKVKSKFKLDGTKEINMFEMPIDSGFAELVVSPGSIVVFPYMLAADGPDPDYPDVIVANMMRIFCKCPDVMFVLLGLTSDQSPDLPSIASRYENQILKQFQRLAEHELESNISNSVGSEVMMGRLFFGAQQRIMNAEAMFERLAVITDQMHREHIPANQDAVIEAKTSGKPVKLLLSAMLNVEAEDNSGIVKQIINDCVRSVQLQYSWYFMEHQDEMAAAITDVAGRSFDLTSLKQLTNDVTSSSKVWAEFRRSSGTGLKHNVGKLLEHMNNTGMVLYYPDVEGGCCMNNFAFLMAMYTRFVLTTSEKKACWRYIGKDIPCWTAEDIEAFCPDANSRGLLLELLVSHGVLLRLPRDPWVTGVSGTHAYVLYNHLPYYPSIDLEELWPDGVPSDEMQIERYLTFCPSVPYSYFPSLIRECIELGGIKLLWNKGIVIQKGPVTILLEMLTSKNNVPVLFLGLRKVNNVHSGEMENTLLKVVWSTFEIYMAVVEELTQKMKIYISEAIPCITCHPPKNRYKTINARSAEIYMINEQYLMTRSVIMRDVTCPNDGSIVDKSVLGLKDGPNLRDIVPLHYYLGCVPTFSAYNRCMFCKNCAYAGSSCPGNLQNGTTAWNCSCSREGQMCDRCGMCQRCVTTLARKEAFLAPRFQKDGSFIHVHADKGYKLEQEVTPNYTPTVEIIPVRGSALTIDIKLGGTSIIYETGTGTITEMAGKNKISDSSNEKHRCKEGHRISIRLAFAQEDLDDMTLTIQVLGEVIFTYPTSTQSCSLSLASSIPASAIVYQPEAKRIYEPAIDEYGEKTMCSYIRGTEDEPFKLATHSAYEATLTQGKQYVENALFQSGGVNYSGSSYIPLPNQISLELLQYPSSQVFKEKLKLHLLCYTRSKISDVLSFGGGQAVPESWSVYRMIHLVNGAGLTLPEAQQLAIMTKSGQLLWGWIFLYRLHPTIQLPKDLTQFLPSEILDSATPAQIEAGLRDVLELSYWNIMSKLTSDEILPVYEDTAQLLQQTLVLQKVTGDNIEATQCARVESKFNSENILYLCAGHHASMRATEGLTKVLPEVYGSYSMFLLSVDMPSNQLTEIPDKMFEALPNLAEFDCSNNFIEVLPGSIKTCKNLYSLIVAENNLTDLPDTLQECSGLCRLDVSSNMMDCLPRVVTKLTQLQRLYANNMFMTALAQDIGNLVNLEKLYLNGNCFTSLPTSFVKLQSLSDLGLAGVPWLTMSKTKQVMSYENFLTKLSMWRLDRWLEVQEHHNEKATLFKFFDEDGNGVLDRTEMGKLNACIFNMFPRFGYKGIEPPEDDTASGFPTEILECRNLEYINIFYQGIVSVPPGIGNLQDLKILNISHNPNLLSIPAEVGNLSSLTRLELEECPLLKTPPKEIRVKGFSTTFAYLRRLMTGSLPCKRTKLMLVGLGGAGKTSLVNALMSKDGTADLKHGEAITDGIDISTWTVKAGDEALTYSVWDFAGQTVYYNTHQYFMSNRAVYLLLWNVRLGFEHAGLDFWLSSISVQAPKAPIFVVGSHVDQVNKFELPMADMKARYKQIAGFHFVSNFSGQGIKELQDSLYDVTLQQQYMGEQIPEVWLTFENNVISARSSCNIMEYSALEKLANVSGIFEKTEIIQAVQFLHDLGSLQHFTTETLKSKVVVNPQWIVDVMACVVSVKDSPIQRGRLKHCDIGAVWKDYHVGLHDWLLGLTEVFDLTFRLAEEPVNLVPCLLPEKQPDIHWPDIEKDSGIKENKMIYKFDYLPAGLFNRGQVRLHQISDSALIWKRGSFLNKNGHIALLQQNRESELIVQVQGPRPENVIFLVHEVFEGLISESFRGVTYDFQIPCPDCLKMYAKDPHMFAASTIRRAIEMKSPFLQCITYFHVISCVDLLACMPPDSDSHFDLHLVQSVRGLRDLRKELAADIFISFCDKDAPADRKSVIHPATVNEDLQALGYKCWFADPAQKASADDMARSLSDAAVFVVFMSVDYTKNDDCVALFKYAKLTLRKPMVVVAVGDNFDFKSSRLGIHLSDEVFVNMTKSKREVYKTKFDELVNTITSRTNRKVGFEPIPSCFFSYTWVNSRKAVTLGTRSVTGALGYGDPRDIKKYLEDKGVKCWIDVERVGQNGLFDDIAEGLLSAKVVVVCVSDEYAASPTCQIEFRYAANTLGLPIILAVVGTGSKWRASEVGVLSLRYPLVSFQEKSDTAYDKLLSMVQDMLPQQEQQSSKDKKNSQNEKTKNLSFMELFELAQRKLLRQLCFYAEHQDVDIYPRLFLVDFQDSKLDHLDTDKDAEGHGSDADSVGSLGSAAGKKGGKKILKRMASIDEHQFTKKVSELKAAFRVQRYSVHTLCEHDEGWHSVTEPIPLPHDFGESHLDKFSPFVARVMAVMKFNKKMSKKLNCLQHELGEDYLKWLEENPAASLSDYQSIYHEFRQMVIDSDSHKTMGQLARCRLPNGKTIWLCEKHHKSMKVTLLGSEDTETRESTKGVNDDLHLITGLRSTEESQLKITFTSSRTAKRSVENAHADPTKSNASDMYTTYELLPDTKVQAPGKSSKKKKKMDKKDADADTVDEQTPEADIESTPSKSKHAIKSKKATKKHRTMKLDRDILVEEEEAEITENIASKTSAGLENENQAQSMDKVTPTKRLAEENAKSSGNTNGGEHFTEQSKTVRMPVSDIANANLADFDREVGKQNVKGGLQDEHQGFGDVANSSTKGEDVIGWPGMGARAKTSFLGSPRKSVDQGTKVRPRLPRSKTDMPSEKPKSKTCIVM